MKRTYAILIVLALAVVIGGLIGWYQYRQIRADYDAYRTLIQRGVTVAGVDVGWHTPEQAREKVMEWVAEPYYDALTLHYQDETVKAHLRASVLGKLSIDNPKYSAYKRAVGDSADHGS